jgi:hypothetical protein
MSFKKIVLCGILFVVAYMILAGGALGHTTSSPAGAAQLISSSFGGQQTSQNGKNAWDITSAPRLSGKQLNTILSAYHSPMAGLGQYIYDQGHSYQISSDFAMAFWLHESTLGTAGEARTTYSPGNLRCVADRDCVDQQRGGYAQMLNWQDGITHWYQLLSLGYVQGQVTKSIVGHACTTLAEIIPVYAPSSDHNDEQQYIQSLIYIVTSWRAGKVVLS